MPTKIFYISSSLSFDPDAAAYIALVEAADGQWLEAATKIAINTLVVALKSAAVWTITSQLLLPCGARTLAGALIPLKGKAPTNGNGSESGATVFTSSNYNRKTGLKETNNTGRYLNSNILSSSLPVYSQSLFFYGSITATTGTPLLIGSFGGSSATTHILDEWSNYGGRVYRSASYFPAEIALNTSTSPRSCMIGSRTAQNLITLYCDGVATSSTASPGSAGLASLPLLYFCYNYIGTPLLFSSASMQAAGIFSQGLTSTQEAALRTATAAYVAAIAAAF
jgi:hypothetical protein